MQKLVYEALKLLVRVYMYVAVPGDGHPEASYAANSG